MRWTEIITERSTTDLLFNSLGRPINSPEAFWKWFGKSKIRDSKGRPLVVYHGTDSDFSKFDPSLSNANTNTGVPRGTFVFSSHSGVADTYTAVEYDKNGWRDPKITNAFSDLIQSGAPWAEQVQFLADHPSGYDEYKEGGNIMPCYLRMVKPLIVDAKGFFWNDIYYKPPGYDRPEEFTTNEIAQDAMDAGYDGCIIKNVKDSHKAGRTQIANTYYVFSPSQIKSAISNKGGYSRDSHDIQEDEKLELPDIEVGDEVLVGKFKNRRATVKGFTTDDHNQPVLKTSKGDQKLFKPRIAKLMQESAGGYLAPTPENISAARSFAMQKWKERASERGAPEPSDLSYSCKFTSLFARQLFGGKIQGSWDHQFIKLDDGSVVDLNIDAEDVKALGDNAHTHDPSFFRGNHDWKDSMQSIKPRVANWVKEFKASIASE